MVSIRRYEKKSIQYTSLFFAVNSSPNSKYNNILALYQIQGDSTFFFDDVHLLLFYNLSNNIRNKDAVFSIYCSIVIVYEYFVAY